MAEEISFKEGKSRQPKWRKTGERAWKINFSLDFIAWHIAFRGRGQKLKEALWFAFSTLSWFLTLFYLARAKSSKNLSGKLHKKKHPERFIAPELIQSKKINFSNQSSGRTEAPQPNVAELSFCRHPTVEHILSELIKYSWTERNG